MPRRTNRFIASFVVGLAAIVILLAVLFRIDRRLVLPLETAPPAILYGSIAVAALVVVAAVAIVANRRSGR